MKSTNIARVTSSENLCVIRVLKDDLKSLAILTKEEIKMFYFRIWKVKKLNSLFP